MSAKQYTYLTATSILVFFIFGIITLDDYGMGWDEVTRWKAGDLKLDYYKALASGQTEEAAAKLASDDYPGLFDLPLALFHRIFGGNRMIQGHVLSILFGVVGLAATAMLGRIACTPRTGFYSVLILLLYPNFFGHSMINPKDIPFMATYTLATAMVLLVFRNLLRDGKASVVTYLLAGLTIGLAASSRLPGLIFLVLGPLTWIIALNSGRHKHSEITEYIAPLVELLKGMAIISISAILILLIFFPRLHSQLIGGVPDVATSLHTRAADIPLLFAGNFSTAGEGPFAYPIRFFILSTPLWMLVLLVAGITLLIKSAIGEKENRNQERIMAVTFLLLSAFPWAYTLITKPALHNGIRHMLFAIPPLIVMMGYGFDKVQCYLKGFSKTIQRLPVYALTALAGLQVFHLIAMHPYQYVSFNMLAGPKSEIPNRYEVEYWFTSSKHLLEKLPELLPQDTASGKIHTIRIAGPLSAALPFVPEGFKLVDDMNEADFFISNTTFRTDLLADGEVVYSIEREGMPIGVIKKLR